MEKVHRTGMLSEPATSITPLRFIGWGSVAGLLGVIAMDIVMLGSLASSGMPADTCFVTIGKTAVGFFSILGMRLTGEVRVGVMVFHLLGPLLGAIYGAILSQIHAFQQTNLKKSLLCAVLYAEVVSQLILSLMPILLRMPFQEAILWFAGSLVLHSIWGVVMGSALYYLLRSRTLNSKIFLTDINGGISWKIKWLAR